ncbi:hypothetical protein [Agarivorans sp. Alg241-V36]|uniref:capsular polysaccharide export protein, LipB/KpsS family n=1 Tax=Agarivorans sp. Alg241-V36 TaxID=2305992 RepID=UPI0013D6DE9C|nr:hypothetical protein [Agarivorans sp. Alg241-V36]
MVLIFIDNIDRLNFFERYAQATLEKCLFVTTKHYISVKLSRKYKVFLLGPLQDCITHLPSDEQVIRSCTHVYRGSQSVEKAQLVYSTVFELLNKIDLNIHEVSYGMIFNGNAASQKAFAEYMKINLKACIYCEIGNFPRKMFFDIKGVNAQSSLYSEPGLLDEIPPVSDNEHNAWIDGYEEYKSKPLPQSKIRIEHFISYISDSIFSYLGYGIREESVSLLKRGGDFLKLLYKKRFSLGVGRKKISSLVGEQYESSVGYVFFPTQVRFDSQLILNSDVDNILGLKKAKVYANSKGLDLYVKVHPAETSHEILSTYNKLKDEIGFKLVSGNTNELIKCANAVVTINSTVGLESLIYRKETLVLGRALYSGFDFERTKKYIHHYLIDVDYFSSEPIDTSILQEIERKLKVSCNF